ncbi:MAG TPA: hypothetical protein GX521_09995 [Firmicutes bacterium]|nr:hypothetical protein [Bacillota bacterium]
MKKVLALGEKITLRDGKEYTILPFTLEDMQWAMDKLPTVNIGVVMLNFYEEEDRENLYSLLGKVLGYAHPELKKKDIKKLIDVVMAKKILEIAVDISGFSIGEKEDKKK